MAFESLDEFISAAASIGESQLIEGADLDLDVGCLTELFNERKGPMLLFDKFSGFPEGFRVCSNALRTPRRFALAMGFPLDAHPVELVKLWRERKKTLGEIAPAVVKDGPVLSHVLKGDDVDLGKFPVPMWHSHDGGRYIGTGDMVITRDPETGWFNLGVYRGQIQGRDRMSLWINPSKHGRILIERYWAKGEAAPIAVVLGCDPLTWMTASMASPFGTSEYVVAGAYRGEAVKVIHLPNTGFPVPAEADLVIEGDMPPLSVESAFEGPHGEWPGYYSHEGPEPVVRISSIYYRPRPILLGMPNLRPLGDGNLIGVPALATQTWDHLEHAGITDIAGVWCFGFFLIVVISLRQRYPGHARQALLAASGFRLGDMKRYFIAVDEDIDPSNIDEVLWAISTRVDPATSIDIVRGAWTASLDPRLSPEQRRTGDLTMGRMLIDACKPYHWRDEYPRSNVYSSEERAIVTKRWSSLLEAIDRRDVATPR